jgi:hypothetical protein
MNPSIPSRDNRLFQAPFTSLAAHTASLFMRWPCRLFLLPCLLVSLLGEGCVGCESEEPISEDGVIVDPAILEACQAEIPGVEQVCQRSLECNKGYSCQKPDGAAIEDWGCCVTFFCNEDDECPIGEYCDERRSLCIPSPHACEDDPTACSDEQCVVTEGNSTCLEPQAAEACSFEKSIYRVADGGEVRPKVQATGLSGMLIPFSDIVLSSTIGEVTEDNRVSGNCETDQPCSGTLSATVGNATCDSTLVIFPSPEETMIGVVVTDRTTGAPLENAAVLAGSDTLLEYTTSAFGYTTIQGPVSFVTAMEGERAVSILSNIQGGTVQLPVPSAPDPTKIAGVKGTVDFSEIKRGTVQWALSGIPLPPSPLDVKPEQLLGQWAQYEQNEPFFVEYSAILPYGMSFNEYGPKSEFVALGRDTPGTIWTLAAPLTISEATVVAEDEEGEPMGLDKSRQFFSFAKFGLHGIGVAQPALHDAPAVPEDYLPIPYADWPVPEINSSQVAPNTYLSRTVEVGLPMLPCVPVLSDCEEGEHSPAVLLMMTVAVPGQGLIPLGFALGYDQQDPAAGSRDGFVEGDEGLPESHLYLDFAPPHDGLEGLPLYVVAMALANEPNDGQEWQVASTQMQPYDDATTDLTINAFLDRPAASLNLESASLTIERADEAELDFVQMRGTQCTWDLIVLDDSEVIELDSLGVNIEQINAISDMTVQSLDADNAQGLTELVELNDGNLGAPLGLIHRVGTSKCSISALQCEAE